MRRLAGCIIGTGMPHARCAKVWVGTLGKAVATVGDHDRGAPGLVHFPTHHRCKGSSVCGLSVWVQHSAICANALVLMVSVVLYREPQDHATVAATPTRSTVRCVSAEAWRAGAHNMRCATCPDKVPCGLCHYFVIPSSMMVSVQPQA